LKIYVIGFLMFFSSISCFGKESSPILYNSFDGMPIGAKPCGMGESFVAIVDNADAPYWNPAGLAFLQRNLCTFMFDFGRSGARKEDIVRGEPLQGRRFTYLSFCSSLGGLSWQPLSNFKEKDNPPYREREIKINKYMLSFAIPYSPKICFGMNISYLYGSLGIAQDYPLPQANISTGNGWGLDWGIIYTHSPLLRIGISLQNGPSYIYWTDYRADRLPPILRVGLGAKMARFLTFAYDFEQRFYLRKINGTKSVVLDHFGLECLPVRDVFLRLGIFAENFSERRKINYTFGLGYRRDSYGLDLALKRFYINGIEAAIYSYVCSLTVPF